MISEKLQVWQERLAKNQEAWNAFADKFDRREALYKGLKEILPCCDGDVLREGKQVPHVRNIVSELIESQVDANLPAPKVTPRREEDQWLAKIIEDMLRNEMNRLPCEELNDRMERTVPIQGGALFLLEWDNSVRTHNTVGELALSALHPKQIVPQDGVYTSIEDMDYIILKLPQTKEYLRRKYKVALDGEEESEPDVKGTAASAADDMVTQYVAYYRNEKGGIGLYSWVNDVELEDLEDYQARRLRRCEQCGAVEPLDVEPLEAPAFAGVKPGGIFPPNGDEDFVWEDESVPLDGAVPQSEPRRTGELQCPYCGGERFEESVEEDEEVYFEIESAHGKRIPGASEMLVGTGERDPLAGEEIMESLKVPTKIPYYKPDIFPVVLQKSVSTFGQLLGDSDVDKIADQQNTTNRMMAKVLDKLLKAGSYITLPADCKIRADVEDMKVIYPESPADKAMIDVYNLEGEIGKDLAIVDHAYEEARQVIGITDSFQGRRDPTATSGRAKEFSAAQAAGRLESKRVMKNAAYAALFEAMFKFRLAYTDEPRPVTSRTAAAGVKYDTFDRYDFLEQDAAGEWYWNDQFLFSCDTAAPLAANREVMWQETRMNLQTGAFGNPTDPDALILFWSKMAMLHYPGAEETKSFLEEQREEQRQKIAQQQSAALAQAGQGPGGNAAASPLMVQAPPVRQ